MIRAKAPTPKDALKVLLVDDNETAVDSLKELLALRGYEIEVAYNGRLAIEKARTFRPQVAILDVGMPEIDGYEVAGLLREQGFPCIFIALTGFGHVHDKRKASVAGFDFHLTKPTGIKEIEVVLQRAADAIKKQAVYTR